MTSILNRPMGGTALLLVLRELRIICILGYVDCNKLSNLRIYFEGAGEGVATRLRSRVYVFIHAQKINFHSAP